MNNNFYIPQLSPYKDIIHSIWYMEGTTSFQTECIIPQGIIEIIFNFSSGPPIAAELNSKLHHLPSCFITGFNTAPIYIHLPEQQYFFGVRLQPLAVKKIFRTPGCEFYNSATDLALVDAGFHSLWHQLAELDSFDAKVAAFLAWTERKISEWEPREILINNFLSTIRHHDKSVQELADIVCYSPRHLSRKLSEATGMNTEEILVYKKYLHAVELTHTTDLSLTEIAYRSHFSDQPHCIKSFKTFTTMTPGKYRKSKSYLKGHIFKDVR